MELRTPRLVLREYTQDDFAAVHLFTSDPDIARHVDWGPNTEEDTQEFLDGCRDEQEEEPRTGHTFAVTTPGGEPFGSVGVYVDGPHQAHIGFVIRRNMWGSGYATEAAREVLKFAFDTLGVHRVSATCRPDNTGSYLVLEKVGMVREGHLRDHILIRDEWHDSLLYAATAPARD